MTDRLSVIHFFQQSEPLSGEIIEAFSDIERDLDVVVFPDVTLDDLQQYDMAPDDLLNGGEDVPDDEDDALEFAIEKFRESDAYYEWQDGLRPIMYNLWPCEPLGIEDQELANKIHEMGLSCCYVNGDYQGRTYQGFILTGGGMNLSDHLAMAYVSAGHVPPHYLLHDAVRVTSDDDWRERLLDAMVRGRDYMKGQVDLYADTLDLYRPDAPSLT